MGATREQVIEKLGVPDVLNTNSMVMYTISYNGFLSALQIYFNNNGMYNVFYDVGRYQRINTVQLGLAFITSLNQLTEVYGTYHEIYANPYDAYQEQYYVWHFSNFYIVINTVINNSNGLFICFYPTSTWNQFETEKITNQKLIRFPNLNIIH